MFYLLEWIHMYFWIYSDICVEFLRGGSRMEQDPWSIVFHHTTRIIYHANGKRWGCLLKNDLASQEQDYFIVCFVFAWSITPTLCSAGERHPVFWSRWVRIEKHSPSTTITMLREHEIMRVRCFEVIFLINFFGLISWIQMAMRFCLSSMIYSVGINVIVLRFGFWFFSPSLVFLEKGGIKVPSTTHRA